MHNDRNTEEDCAEKVQKLLSNKPNLCLIDKSIGDVSKIEQLHSIVLSPPKCATTTLAVSLQNALTGKDQLSTVWHLHSDICLQRLLPDVASSGVSLDMLLSHRLNCNKRPLVWVFAYRSAIDRVISNLLFGLQVKDSNICQKYNAMIQNVKMASRDSRMTVKIFQEELASVFRTMTKSAPWVLDTANNTFNCNVAQILANTKYYDPHEMFGTHFLRKQNVQAVFTTVEALRERPETTVKKFQDACSLPNFRLITRNETKTETTESSMLRHILLKTHCISAETYDQLCAGDKYMSLFYTPHRLKSFRQAFVGTKLRRSLTIKYVSSLVREHSTNKQTH